MTKRKKITLTVLWGLAVLSMMGVVVARWPLSEQDMPVLFDAPHFSLTDQNGNTVTDNDLKGNVWVTIVFFASCPGVCPMMSARMAELQKTVDLPDLKIVSISVDPEHDTPEILKKYAEGMGADQSRWYLLTGKKDDLFATARGFNLVAIPASNGNAIVHDEHALLIDRNNHVRGVYATRDSESMKKLAIDARTLAER